jgi:gliding motility-associated-like protein
VVNGFFTLDPFVNDVIEINIDSTNTYAVGGFAPVTLTVEPVPNNLIVSWCFEGVPVPELSGSSVVVPVLREGDNLYSAKFVDSFGCAREIAVTVIGVLPIIQIPKAFKPRSMDDDNKVFRPFITNAEGSPADLIADFKIFNRWGELVYDNDDNDNGWDGQQDGEDAPAEVYIYLITIAYPDGSTELFKGDVTLLR